jgi:tRNA threonylcarbamoyladenosine biosynthesis protein TsaB
MKLYIDTSNRGKAIIKFNDEVFETESRRDKNILPLRGKSQTLLPFIEQELSDRHLTFSDITEIEVATGPGSFTGLRVGLSIAQTLAWLLHVPLNGKHIDKGEHVPLSY